MAIPFKMTVRLDAGLRAALEKYMERADLTSSAAVRVLLTQALRSAGVTNVDYQNAILNEARREVRAKAKEALERVLQDLENG